MLQTLHNSNTRRGAVLSVSIPAGSIYPHTSNTIHSYILHMFVSAMIIGSED